MPALPVVYAAEREAGLEETIRSTARIAYASQLEIAEPASLPEAMLARLKASAADEDARNFDLFHLQSILATVGWNKNDDVFDKAETWQARHTPVDKPFNWEHNQDDIVGHITASYVVDDKLKAISEEAVIDDLPDKFHVFNREVLYRCWEDPEKQKRMDQAIAEIGKGKWYVSMEALFQNFDYALQDAQGKGKVVARNEETAFLTKHLRAYGGKGLYNGLKVGRVLRNFTFSGKGLVRKPANPESIIVTDSQIFKANSTEENFSQIFSTMGYGEATDKENQMTDFEKKWTEAQKEIETLKAQLHANDTNALKARAESLEDELRGTIETMEGHKKKAAELEDAHGKLKAEHDDLKSKHEELKDGLEKAHKELKDLNDKATKANRIAASMTALEMDQEAAEAHVEKLAHLDDAAFAATNSYMAEKMADYKKAQPTVVKQEVPPAATETKPEVKPIPKATSAPSNGADKVPTAVKKIDDGGNAPPISPANPLPENGHEEFDGATAAVTDPANLETAKPVQEPALAAAVTPPGVEKVRASIAEFMGPYLGVKVTE